MAVYEIFKNGDKAELALFLKNLTIMQEFVTKYRASDIASCRLEKQETWHPLWRCGCIKKYSKNFFFHVFQAKEFVLLVEL